MTITELLALVDVIPSNPHTDATLAHYPDLLGDE